MDHVQQFRAWINPYPLDGLKSLLQVGILFGKDAYEKNWCTLQMAKILSEERTNKELVQKILNQIARDHNGEILLMEQDEYLLNNVMQLSRCLF